MELELINSIRKKRGGRIKNKAIYKLACNPYYHNVILAEKSLKTMEDINDGDIEKDLFTSILLTSVLNKNLVVKVQDVRHPNYHKELNALKFLTEQNVYNTVQYICDFRCKSDKLLWKRPILSKTKFCLDDDGKHELGYIVMEFLPYNLVDYLSKNNLELKSLNEIIKQLTFTLIILNINFNLNHNDLNSDNLLLEILEKPIEITYKIKHPRFRKTLTLGKIISRYRPVIIDFQLIDHSKSPFKSSELFKIRFQRNLLGHLPANGILDNLQSLYVLLEHVLENDKYKTYFNKLYYLTTKIANLEDLINFTKKL